MSSSSIKHTATVSNRQREERSGAEATKLTLTELVVASYGSNVTPEEEEGEHGEFTDAYPCSLRGDSVSSPLRYTGLIVVA